jgi:hypothetical protein
LLIPALAIATARFENRSADGPSRLFPGGELLAGELYMGPEPDWSFTDEIPLVELQLIDPLSSRLMYIMENGGKIYVASSYMSTFLGRLWKKWAVQAEEGDGAVVMRLDGLRYERQLVRITEGPELGGVVAKMTSKYNSPTTEKSIEGGHTWIFELAPKGS